MNKILTWYLPNTSSSHSQSCSSTNFVLGFSQLSPPTLLPGQLAYWWMMFLSLNFHLKQASSLYNLYFSLVGKACCSKKSSHSPWESLNFRNPAGVSSLGFLIFSGFDGKVQNPSLPLCDITSFNILYASLIFFSIYIFLWFRTDSYKITPSLSL